MTLIKTNKKMREYYTKHINKLIDYENGDFDDIACYMCEADFEALGGCSNCPLELSLHNEISCINQRRKNLRNLSNKPTNIYRQATPKSIRKHRLWIEEQIDKFTDCKMEDA